MANRAREVVEQYFRAWTSNRVDEAFALLAADLKFVGPTASYTSAEAFRPGLTRFAALAKDAQIVEILEDGERVAMLYTCQMPPPVGVLRIASFFRVEAGKITWYETQFDVSELRKLLAR